VERIYSLIAELAAWGIMPTLFDGELFLVGDAMQAPASLLRDLRESIPEVTDLLAPSEHVYA